MEHRTSKGNDGITAQNHGLDASEEQGLMGMKNGDIVTLSIGGKVVGEGSIHSCDPTAVCNFIALEQSRVSVIIEKVIVKDAMLPYPTTDASLLEQAIGSFVLWDINNICRKHMDQEKLDINKSKTREDWVNQKVLLWSFNQTQVVAEGYILLAYPHEAIDYKELGNDHVGITISKIYGNLVYQIDEVVHEVNEVENIHIQLLKWPIAQVTLEDGSKLIDHQQEDDIIFELHEQDMLSTMHIDAAKSTQVVRKKKYRMVNRKASQNEDISNPSKIPRLLMSESIHAVSIIDCCDKNCCQHVERKKIEEARQQYWGQNSSDRITYVYDMLQASQSKEGKERGITMLFCGGTICGKAWYTIHGISKASFHRYKASYEQGSRKATHGNTGIIRRAWAHVDMAKAIIQDYVDNNAEIMPHRSRTTFEGDRDNQLVLAGVYKQQDILREVNITLSSLGYKSISHSTLSRLWRTIFKQVSLCKSSSFSKCDICTSIQMKLASTKVVQDRANLFMEKRKHMLAQMTCRNLYYSWKQKSCCDPSKYVCIIHDKMDQVKTCIPRLEPHPKSLSRVMQLPISLTGMLVHGHKKSGYGHFAMGYWPSDPNFTVGSLARCLRHLELPNENVKGDVKFQGVAQQAIFDRLLSRDAYDIHQKLHEKKSKDSGNSSESMREEEFYLVENGNVITHVEGSSLLDVSRTSPLQANNATMNVQCLSQLQNGSFNALPRVLFLQLDNCGSENKNRYVFAFLSLLTARGIFEIVHLGFLMVGHTHEDVDAMFSRLSERLRSSCVFSFCHLMDAFIESSCFSPVPYLMQEIPNFKSFIDGYICDGTDALVGHKKPLQFRFFVRDGIPIMQYMMNPTTKTWKPQEGIRLWKQDHDGHPMLPKGDPLAVPLLETLKDQNTIMDGLRKYLSFWKRSIESKNVNPSFKNFISPIIKYWDDIKNVLENVNITNNTQLMDGFWPKTNWRRDDMEDRHCVEAEDDDDEHYCGPAKGKPKVSFKPHMDVYKDQFVLVRPNENVYPIWLGDTLSDVDKDKDSPNYMKVLVQYWAPIVRGTVSIVERYKDCWTKQWRSNPYDPQRWEPISVIVWSWRPRRHPNLLKAIKIPLKVIESAQENLSLVGDIDNEDVDE